jgi:hypothetical protein
MSIIMRGWVIAKRCMGGVCVIGLHHGKGRFFGDNKSFTAMVVV